MRDRIETIEQAVDRFVDVLESDRFVPELLKRMAGAEAVEYRIIFKHDKRGGYMAFLEVDVRRGKSQILSYLSLGCETEQYMAPVEQIA